jgi:hypothetical protein
MAGTTKSKPKGRDGARLHTESLRSGGSWPAARDPRSRALRDTYARLNEEQSQKCAECGAVALYRVFGQDGRHSGACKAHRDVVRNRSVFFRDGQS